jgi:hypothetical protein
LNQFVVDVIEKQVRKANGAIFETSQPVYSARLVLKNNEIILNAVKKAIN